MNDEVDDQDPIIEQDEADFEEEGALGQGISFRRPSEPLTLVLGEKDRSTMLQLDNKKKELLHIKTQLDMAIGE